ncbi:hypothetical protein BGZ65_010051 [Modicella reniformis]|uniref:Splicing factor 3A subunit 1 conserved domain-containing protein n=1 Tax=Modicella reniformis TaxID=1440133 RepID=A0A9P6J4I9_9FUNG|nr:hypothetical protein BGZ65_010051 [Modicella reniformis]
MTEKRMMQVLAEIENIQDMPVDMEIDENDDDDDLEMEDWDDEQQQQQQGAFKGRTGAALEEAIQTCPRGEQVKLSDMDEHFHIELLDPRWKEMREQTEAKTKKANNMVSDGTDVARNLNMLKAQVNVWDDQYLNFCVLLISTLSFFSSLLCQVAIKNFVL